MKIFFVGIFDLLLHKRDVAYTVQTLRDWIEKSGQYFVDYDEIKGKHDLTFKALVRNFDFAELIQTKTEDQIEYISEMINGYIIKHSFFISKIKNSVASLNDPQNSLYTFRPVYELKKQIEDKRTRYSHKNETYFYGFMSLGSIIRDVSSSTCLLHPDYGDGKMILRFELNDVSEFIAQKFLTSHIKINLSLLYKEYKRRSKDDIEQKIFRKLAMEFIRSISYTDIFLIKKTNINTAKNLFSNNCYKMLTHEV